jgi:hypothetical protein
MPCIFCIAVFLLLAGAVTAGVIDSLEERLKSIGGESVQRTAESSSVTKWNLNVDIGDAVPDSRGGRSSAPAAVPVAVTVYKAQKRVRIQVLTHSLTRAEAEVIEDRIADALQLRVIERSSAESEAKVREAVAGSADVPPQTNKMVNKANVARFSSPASFVEARTTANESNDQASPSVKDQPTAADTAFSAGPMDAGAETHLPIPPPAGAQNSETELPKPMWADDPSGRHQYRYWDGRTWTDRVADGGHESNDRLVPKPPK